VFLETIDITASFLAAQHAASIAFRVQRSPD
jgi:hypothetical protein